MMQEFLANSFLFGGNAPFVEQLYEDWLENPQAVPAQWREYFERLQLLPAPAGKAVRDVAHAQIVEAFAERHTLAELEWPGGGAPFLSAATTPT